eukprot:scaffold4222_cov115-Cylindrotheca_fusiformis.AAC.11
MLDVDGGPRSDGIAPLVSSTAWQYFLWEELFKRPSFTRISAKPNVFEPSSTQVSRTYPTSWKESVKSASLAFPSHTNPNTHQPQPRNSFQVFLSITAISSSLPHH